MATELKQNNSFINEFKGGMNSDLGYDVLLPNLYVFGENIRITTNNLLFKINNSNDKEGSVNPIPVGIKVTNRTLSTVKDILASDSIGDVGVILTRNNDNKWSIYRVNKIDDDLTITHIFTSVNTIQHDNKFSIVLNKEINDDIILYIVDGVHQIMSVNINDDEYNSNITDECLFISEYYFPIRKVYISDVITGSLKTGQVQYTYRFYKKYGIKSKLAPLTNKIQVIDSQKRFETGNAKDTKTGIGFKLLIQTDSESLKIFNKILVYRLHYSEENTDSDIELIYDDYILDRDNIVINDIGITALETYTPEEFSVLDGLLIIPQVIELNQNYMFAANVKDITKLDLEDSLFDARSYSMDSNKKIQLYDLDDINYEGTPYEYDFSTDSTLSDLKRIDKDKSLNKYSDVNLQITDDTDYCRLDDESYYGGVGANVSWRFITTPILLHKQTQIDSKLPPKDLDSGVLYLYYLKNKAEEDGSYSIELEKSNFTTNSIFYQNNMNTDRVMSYEDPIVSSMFRSLKRDETYRYGIVLYDKEGRKSDVQWIADIKTPSIKKFGSTSYVTTGTDDSGTITPGSDGSMTEDNLFIVEQKFTQTSSTSSTTTEYDFNDDIMTELWSSYDNYRNGYSNTVAVNLNSTIGIYTPDYKSNPINLKKGQKLKLSIYKDSTIIISGQTYRWYYGYNGDTNTFSTTGGVGNFPTITVDSTSLAEQKTIEFNSVDFSGCNLGNRISNISFNYEGYLLISNGDKVLVGSNEYYTVTEDCTAYLYSYSAFHYTRKEYGSDLHTNTYDITNTSKNNQFDSTTGFLICTSDTISTVGSNTILYYLEIDSSDVETETEDTETDTEDSNEDTESIAKSLKGLIAYPLGILFNVHDLPDNIVAYLIVRCEKLTEYTKNIIQCAVARPIRQKYRNTKTNIDQYSPYYPFYVLTALPYAINSTSRSYGVDVKFGGSSVTSSSSSDGIEAITDMSSGSDDRNVFQLYSPEITLARNTTLLKVSKQTYLDFLKYYYQDKASTCKGSISSDSKYVQYTRQGVEDFIGASSYDKSQFDFMYTYYYQGIIESTDDDCKFRVLGIADTLNPTWESGFGNVTIGTATIDGTATAGAITYASKNYKQYISVVDDKEYLNWHCTGMYNLKAYRNDSSYGQSDSNAFMLVENISGVSRKTSATGLIGPGPVCYVASVEDKDSSPIYDMMPIKISDAVAPANCAYLCNIVHSASQFAGYTKEDRKYDQYYGFGNFVVTNSGYTKYNVFDGDTYITPFEIVQMYKAFDFNDVDSLLSGQFVYYIPIESAINNYFNYGYNYTNTKSKTLQLEAGEITGIATLERSSNQYNTIYSDNNKSNDIYNSDYDEDDINLISQRIYYSQQKISGEGFDNYTYFKPLNYIDVDTRYGEITSILSNRDILYCWQDNAFGRIHVNERSLVSDTNSNLIQLGTGGVMQRIDYIDLHYGMSKYQHAAVGVEDKIYWIDDKNKAILLSDGTKAINLSEQSNVLNIVNEKFNLSCPTIDYDLQNQELLCRCFDGDLIVFNTKLNVATSLYTRSYLDIISINNVIYGIDNNINLMQYNNIETSDNITYMPTTLVFVINGYSSTTKVYDNQELVMIGECTDQTKLDSFINNKTFSFCTNVYLKTSGKVEHTSREGNIQYVIPRLNNVDYGNRYRGKWMCVEIKDDGNNYNFAISHIITKFRQSFS